MAGLDSNRGAKRAREARAALALDPISPHDCLLRTVEERAAVIVAALPDGVAGACYRNDAGAILWVNGEQAVQRQRFTLAHELGHVWCGHDGTLEPDTVETLSGRTSNPYEIQANAFAAEFLMPRAGIEQRVGGEPTLEDVVRLAGEYGVSAIALVYRLKQLKLASAERVARLQAEVDEGLHRELFGEPLQDRLASIDALPYLSPALEGSLLHAMLNGDAAPTGAIDRIMRPGRR